VEGDPVNRNDLEEAHMRDLQRNIRPWPSRLLPGSLFLMLLALLQGCASASDPGSITGEALQARLGTEDAPIILDVRTPFEFQNGHVPGAYNLEDQQVPSRIQELLQLKDREIVVYCESGPRSRWVESYLKQNGFTNVKHLTGDMKTWRADGRPVE
jgi:phage shock protein E